MSIPTLSNRLVIELPQDIWDLIAQFLPESELLRLVALNRPMFNIALSRRYRTVIWADPDEKMVKLLKRLQEPVIAAHVRRIQMRAWFMKRLLDLNASTIVHEVPQSLSDKVFGLIDFGSKRVRKNNPPKVPASSISNVIGLTDPLYSVLAFMSKAMGLMVNLRSFTVEWRDLPFSKSSQAFLTSANQSFSDNLCKLSLSGQLSRMEQIMPLAIFRKLEDIELKFDYDERCRKTRAANEALLTNVVIPYLNSHRGTLRSLSIISQADADHSRFLRVFPQLRLLQSLTLQFPFDHQDFSDPDTLRSLLRVHSYKLRNVEILPIRVWEHQALASVKANWETFTSFFATGCDWLPNLTSFSIPSMTHLGTISIIRNMPVTVRELRLSHRYHSLEELEDVAQLLDTRNLTITKFSIDLVTGTPEHFRLLSEKLPRLQSLTLVLEQAETFRKTFAELYPNYIAHRLTWNLLELSIYMKNYRDDATVAIPTIQWEEFILAKTVKKIIPSIQRSKGEDVFSHPPTA